MREHARCSDRRQLRHRLSNKLQNHYPHPRQFLGRLCVRRHYRLGQFLPLRNEQLHRHRYHRLSHCPLVRRWFRRKFLLSPLFLNSPLLKQDIATRIGTLERSAFYARARSCFAIVATGERRLYGNLILKKGIIRPEG